MSKKLNEITAEYIIQIKHNIIGIYGFILYKNPDNIVDTADNIQYLEYPFLSILVNISFLEYCASLGIDTVSKFDSDRNFNVKAKPLIT